MEEQGVQQAAFKAYLGEKEATDQIDFDQEFAPEVREPQPIF
jgi:hypothetical protein